MNEKQEFKTVDILADSDGNSISSNITLIKTGEQEIGFIPFTGRGIEVPLHYGQEAEIRRYFLCNGKDCYYCKIGRILTIKLLIPVYLAASRSIGILPVSNSQRPDALLPQLRNILKSDKRIVVFVSYRDYKFTLETHELTEDMDSGEEVITSFLESQPEDGLQLPPMYPSISNDELADIPEVANLLRLKGIIE